MRPDQKKRGAIVTACVVALFSFSIRSYSQSTEPSKWTVTGYHKGLFTLNSFNDQFVPAGIPGLPALPPTQSAEYLYHNRINAKYWGDGWTFHLGMRNRIFSGYTVANFDALAADGVPPYANYASFLDYTHTSGVLPLNIRWFQNDLAAALTVFDRFYFDIDRAKWHLRVGRQRVNWGINQQFNPNDLFNPYNLFDFDYEERPGVDAIRYERYTGPLSSWEVVVAPDTSWARTNAAARFKSNFKGYDFQALAGKYRRYTAVGLGWYGNLGKAGFGGEATFFARTEYLPDLTSNQTNFVFVTSVDHAFTEGPFVSVGYLYNRLGEPQPGFLSLFGQQVGQTSPYNPMPFRHTLTAASIFTLNELTSAGLTFLSTPKAEVFIAVPTLSYSLSQDWDVSLFMQLFLTTNPFEDQYQWMTNALFVRLKQSF
mgnify:CR=1 FL=1